MSSKDYKMEKEAIMFNKNLVLVSGVAATLGAVSVVGVSKAVKGFKKFTDRKKKENEFFNVLKECIEEETNYCINIGIIDESAREKVAEQIFKDTKEMIKNAENIDTVFNMSPDEQRRQLREGLKNSRSAYAVYGFFA